MEFSTAIFHSNLADVGTLYSFSCQIVFQSAISFIFNTGGAISSIQSSLTFSVSNVSHSFVNNTSTFGGAIAMSACQLFVHNSIKVSGNNATVSGGGIYADQSSINISSVYEQINVTLHHNYASHYGGGIHAVASTINIEPSVFISSFVAVSLSSNTAGQSGGGLYLEQNTKLHLLKHNIEKKVDIKYLKLSIVDNTALEYGGGVFVSDKTGSTCYRESGNHVGKIYTLQNECFIQTISFYGPSYIIEDRKVYNTINTFLINNTAGLSGDEIYGGLLDRCAIHPFAEVYMLNASDELENSANTYSGFDYLLSIVHLSTGGKPFAVNTSVSTYVISSDPVQVLYCFGDNFTQIRSTHR